MYIRTNFDILRCLRDRKDRVVAVLVEEICNKAILMSTAFFAGLIIMIYVMKFYATEVHYPLPPAMFVLSATHLPRSDGNGYDLNFLMMAAGPWYTRNYHEVEHETKKKAPISYEKIDSDSNCPFSLFFGRAEKVLGPFQYLAPTAPSQPLHDLMEVNRMMPAKRVDLSLCYIMSEFFHDTAYFEIDFRRWKEAGVKHFVIYFERVSPKFEAMLHNYRAVENVTLVPWPTIPDLIKRNPNFEHNSHDIYLANHCLHMTKQFSDVTIQVPYDDMLPSGDVLGLAAVYKTFIAKNRPSCFEASRRYLALKSGCKSYDQLDKKLQEEFLEYFDQPRKIVRVVETRKLEFITRSGCAKLEKWVPDTKLDSSDVWHSASGIPGGKLCPFLPAFPEEILNKLNGIGVCQQERDTQLAQHRYSSRCGDDFHDCLLQYSGYSLPCITYAAKHFNIAQKPYLYVKNETFDVRSPNACRYSAGVVFSEFPMIY